MPTKWTFQIPPIKRLLDRYVGDGKGWIDPFAGESSPAEITNDINPDRKATYHFHAVDFVKNLKCNEFKGILFDPPYSLHQVKECYNGLGIEMFQDDAQNFPQNIKRLIAPKLIPGGIAICCGWNSQGFGKNLGFKIVEILLVAHGGSHNDTIVTVERKINKSLDDF